MGEGLKRAFRAARETRKRTEKSVEVHCRDFEKMPIEAQKAIADMIQCAARTVCDHGPAEREAASYTEGLCVICLQSSLASEEEYSSRMKRELHACLADLTDERDKLGKAIQALEEARYATIDPEVEGIIDDVLSKIK